MISLKISDFSGQLFVNGKASPLIDTEKISQQLAFKSNKNFVDILKSNVQRAYDFNLRSNSPFGNLPILPALKQNINLIIKTDYELRLFKKIISAQKKTPN